MVPGRGVIGALLLVLGAVTLRAQTIPGAVLAKNEPHHHLVYEDAELRVLRVRVPAHDTTLLHEHDPDYFWVALGNSNVVNARLGSPDATITSKDLSIHYSFGPFAHVARNPAEVPFDNITVELLEQQKDVRNLCEESVAKKPLDCPTSSKRARFFEGATEHPSFATDRIRVSLATLAPGGTLRPTVRARRGWVIALDTADAGTSLAIAAGGSWRGGIFRAPSAGAWAIANRTRSPVRVVTVVDLGLEPR